MQQSTRRNETGDTEADAEWLAAKTAGLRIFNDRDGVMIWPFRYMTDTANSWQKKQADKSSKGFFGADMQCSLINDGPVTIIIDSRIKE